MNTFSKRCPSVWLVLCLICSFTFFFITWEEAADATIKQQAVANATTINENPLSTDFLKRDETYHYRLEGRRDPFLPFITEKAATANPDEIIENQEKLTGMQVFEPGQLTLVALMDTADQKYAMVEDVSGKGYVITEGTKIGRRGIVKSILPNRVVIEETAMTRSGKKLSNEIVMVLRKEEKKK